MITRETRKNIFAHFNMEGLEYSGRMNDLEFLSRIYNLEELPSSDPRYSNAYEDIWQHTENNNDYEENWVFQDARFELETCEDERFLQFLCEMAHPLVRPIAKEATNILEIVNDWLKEDGFEIFPEKKIASGNIMAFRKIGKNKHLVALEEENLDHMWVPNRLRFFISHRDIHKVGAQKLGKDLLEFGVSSFVAHDSIQPMSSWKNEIMKALQTMDACICYITNDFYQSAWTNQEVGYALAKGVPIYLYSVDKSDPQGFKLDTQAIKTGFGDLVDCIKSDFSDNYDFKSVFIQNFTNAKNGSFDNAKNKFFDLVGLTLNDDDIEELVGAFLAKARHINQLDAVLNDPIKTEHQSHPLLRRYKYYREYLENDILKKHSKGAYGLEVDERGYASIVEK